jgi:hypothetical protein
VKIIGAIEKPKKHFQPFADYANKETINRISSQSGYWTADRTGFIKAILTVKANAANSEYHIYINDNDFSESSYSVNYNSNGGSISRILPVTAGDVEHLYQPSDIFQSNACYFIPPKFVTTQAPCINVHDNPWQELPFTPNVALTIIAPLRALYNPYSREIVFKGGATITAKSPGFSFGTIDYSSIPAEVKANFLEQSGLNIVDMEDPATARKPVLVAFRPNGNIQGYSMIDGYSSGIPGGQYYFNARINLG